MGYEIGTYSKEIQACASDKINVLGVSIPLPNMALWTS